MATKELINFTDLEAQYKALVSDIEGMTVENDDDYSNAANFAKTITAKLKELADTDVVAEKKRLYAEYKKYSDAEGVLKKKLEALQKTVRAKITAYVEKKELEARRKAEEAAIAAAVATDDESMLDMVPGKVESTPEVAGVSYAEILDFEVVDQAAVPEKYKMIDAKKLRAAVMASGETVKIPGVRVFKRKQMRVSA